MREPALSIIVILIIAGLAMISCTETKTPAPTSRQAGIEQLPIEFTVRQRATMPVPGSNERLLITIDDISRGQVMVSLATSRGENLLPTRSMSPDAAAAFDFEGQSLLLRLKKLDNALVGEDFASFVITSANGALTETRKIERLIQDVADLSGATFIRNGEGHSASEAADHLRMKWKAAGGNITSADQFIDEVASKSSISGKSYQIQLADGRVVNSADFLRKRLARIEKTPP